MTIRKLASADSLEGRRAAEEARRLLGRAGKARDEDQDDPKHDDTDEGIVEKDRDDDRDDDGDRDHKEEQEDEEADKRAGRSARRAAIRAAVEADRERAATVMEMARAAGLPNFGRRHVEYGTSVREFRQAMKERQGKPGSRPVHRQPSFAEEAARGAQEAKRSLGRK